MHDAETMAEIKRLYYVEHWRIGTIATQLGVHVEVVRRAVNRVPGTLRQSSARPRHIDPFLPWLTETLERYPRLASTVLHRMLRERGYPGGVVQLRRIVRRLRPRRQEAFLRLSSLPGEAAQVDWADFGRVKVDCAQRRLSAFVMTLCHSRALYVEFFFDQSLVSFLRGHIRGFEHFGGVARTVVTDNLRSVVLERRGDQIRFHPRYLELAGHYGFEPRPCHVARGNEKGRVERSIRFLRESFFAIHAFSGLSALNAAVKRWVKQIADARPWPDDRSRTCTEVFAGTEQARLLTLPLHPIDTSERTTVRSRKTLWVRFDRNDYSIPPDAVGKELTLLASDTEVRLLEGSQEIARHRRDYGQGERVTDPAHTRALLASKHAARASALDSPLRLAVPEVAAFLAAAFPRYRNTALLATPLERLLGLYGQQALRAALREALQRGTPTLASVEYLLEKNRRQAQRRPPLPVDLADRPDLAALHVQPHALDAYDRLSKRPAQENRLDQQPPAAEEDDDE